MFILDTDHISLFQRRDPHVTARVLATPALELATTIITVEEIMRGWMADLRRTHNPRRQVVPYARLRLLFRFFATWNVLDWDEAAVDQFEALKASKVRAGTMALVSSPALLDLHFSR